MQFYTYLWLREDGSPYYIGKGNNGRAFSNHLDTKQYRPKDPDRIKVQYWSDEATALSYEMYLIDFWGRVDLGTGCLRNRTDGGDGISGYRFSEEQCKRLSESHKGQGLGQKRSKESVAKSAKTRTGTKRSLETRQKMSTKKKRTVCHRGHPRTPDNVTKCRGCKTCY